MAPSIRFWLRAGRRWKHSLFPQARRQSAVVIPPRVGLDGRAQGFGGKQPNRASQMGSPAKIFLVANALPSAVCGRGYAVRNGVNRRPARLRPTDHCAGTLSQQQPLENLVSVHSRLRTDLNSATAKPGDPVEAVVTQPVFDAQNQLLIPQNSILRGKVLSATPSRSLGRNGLLRFSFNEVTWPSGFRENVDATPAAIESSPDTKLAIDDEGGVARDTNRSIAAPLIMGLLSAQAFGDSDGALGRPALPAMASPSSDAWRPSELAHVTSVVPSALPEPHARSTFASSLTARKRISATTPKLCWRCRPLTPTA